MKGKGALYDYFPAHDPLISALSNLFMAARGMAYAMIDTCNESISSNTKTASTGSYGTVDESSSQAIGPTQQQRPFLTQDLG